MSGSEGLGVCTGFGRHALRIRGDPFSFVGTVKKAPCGPGARRPCAPFHTHTHTLPYHATNTHAHPRHAGMVLAHPASRVHVHSWITVSLAIPKGDSKGSSPHHRSDRTGPTALDPVRHSHPQFPVSFVKSKGRMVFPFHFQTTSQFILGELGSGCRNVIFFFFAGLPAANTKKNQNCSRGFCAKG